ncbi:hypothetical protein [Tsuneonella flava]|uniref:hypothetical protein n=1 Tax=Tsuneonella flava TaxID=2055955 RepID=UPI0018E41285|nr:hypothetical protein [Tsuneonella flava]
MDIPATRPRFLRGCGQHAAQHQCDGEFLHTDTTGHRSQSVAAEIGGQIDIGTIGTEGDTFGSQRASGGHAITERADTAIATAFDAQHQTAGTQSSHDAAAHCPAHLFIPRKLPGKAGYAAGRRAIMNTIVHQFITPSKIEKDCRTAAQKRATKGACSKRRHNCARITGPVIRTN